MLSFGKQRFLVGYMKRLWCASKSDFDKSRGRPMYPDSWHLATRVVNLEWRPYVRYVYREEERNRVEVFERWILQVIFESRVIPIDSHPYWMWHALGTYNIIPATFKLILLQRCVRKYNARRREARRLALAMTLHSRLGNDSWLSIIPTELAHTLMLAAT